MYMSSDTNSSPKIISIFNRNNSNNNPSNKLNKSLKKDYKSPNKDYKSPNKLDKSPNKDYKSPNKLDKSPKKDYKSPNKLDKSPNKLDKSPKKDNNLLKNIINFFGTTPEIISPVIVNSSFDRKTAHKIIDGVKYSSLKELKQNKLKCFFETCEISWSDASWADR